MSSYPPASRWITEIPPAAPAEATSLLTDQHCEELAKLTQAHRSLLADCLYAFRTDAFSYADGAFYLARRHDIVSGNRHHAMGYVWLVPLRPNTRDMFVRLGLIERIPQGLGTNQTHRLSLKTLEGLNLPLQCPSKAAFLARREEYVKMQDLLARRAR